MSFIDRTSANLMRQSTEINTSTNKFSYLQTIGSLAKYKPSREACGLGVPLVIG
jgi:hypothetical protein